MKNTDNSEINENLEDDLLPEYNFDYRKAHPNRFTHKPKETIISVTLASDVPQNTSEVNNP